MVTAVVTPNIMAMAHKAHSGTVKEAISYLNSGNDDQKWLHGFWQYHAKRNATSVNETLIKMAPEPDNFLDTVIGGWWIGYRYFVEVQSLVNVGFTSYWHFTSAYRPGRFGDRHTGYAHPIQPKFGDEGFFNINKLLQLGLYNQEVLSGSFEDAKGLVLGLKDIFQVVTKNWFGLAKDFYMGEKGSSGEWGRQGAPDVLNDYQTQTSSRDEYFSGRKSDLAGTTSRVPASNWDDYQKVFFNPSANAAQYWYNQVTQNGNFDNLSKRDLEMLGFTFHFIADGSTPQHVWNTTAHFHTDFEGFIDKHVGKFKPSKDEIASLLQEFRESDHKTYAQYLPNSASLSDESGDCAPVKAASSLPNYGDGKEMAIKCLKVNNKIDPTLYSASDIVRWLASKAIDNQKVLVDDNEETFKAGAERALHLAMVGEILMLEKAAADLYKKKQYLEKLGAVSEEDKNKIWGNGVVLIGGVLYPQIR